MGCEDISCLQIPPPASQGALAMPHGLPSALNWGWPFSQDRDEGEMMKASQ